MSHYFQTPDSSLKLQQIEAKIWQRTYEFTTANGVFSGSRLDKGTSVLFSHTTPVSGAAKVLDLGCGYGPIAIALASENPNLRVDAVDINERALELTRLNAQKSGVEAQVSPLLPDQVSPDTEYDQIWSNPPIRISKAALHDLLAHWLPRLKADGQAWMVVGKNLGADSLQKWLIEQGWPTEKVGSAKGFRVFKTTRG